MTNKRGSTYLLALALVVVASGGGEAVAFSEFRTTITAPPNTGNDAAPISDRRPAVRSYRERYLSNVAPLIVQCMNDLGWEAEYEPGGGVRIIGVPLALDTNGDGAMRFCVASSHTYRGTYAD